MNFEIQVKSNLETNKQTNINIHKTKQMKNKTILGITVAGAITLMAFTAGTEIYKIDNKSSSLEWTGKKLTGEHTGSIHLTSGTVEVQNNVIKGGKFEIDMTSIDDKDLTGEWKAKLEGHLKSADFFDVAKFPKATFVITSVNPISAPKEGGFTHTVKGNLTIKDKTNEIVFDAIVKAESSKIACVGTATVDRSKFDVKYGSKTFFAEIGDKMIYDEFQLKFNVIAVK
jgi:polyisoprenoid-binding protein YceI